MNWKGAPVQGNNSCPEVRKGLVLLRVWKSASVARIKWTGGGLGDEVAGHVSGPTRPCPLC